MAYEQYHGVALQQRADGALILAFLTSVTVKLAHTATLATLFADADGVVPKTNPFTVDATFATLDFFVTAGRYHIELVKTGWTFPDDLTDIVIGSSLRQHLVTPVLFIDGNGTAVALDAIPVGARVYKAIATNGTAPGASHGLVSYDIGDGSLVDRWGHAIPLTVGHVTTQVDFTNSDPTIYPTGGDVVLSANGGAFDGVGAVNIDIEYEL